MLAKTNIYRNYTNFEVGNWQAILSFRQNEME
jgi:hypothetical protein